MSRLADIIENHQNLDRLLSIVKHYGVSAEYISLALIQQFETDAAAAGDDEENSEDEASKGDSQELIDDLKQFCARF